MPDTECVFMKSFIAGDDNEADFCDSQNQQITDRQLFSVQVSVFSAAACTQASSPVTSNQSQLVSTAHRHAERVQAFPVLITDWSLIFT